MPHSHSDELGRHDHVAGRTRPYISRKWFHRPRHRDTPLTVAEIAESLAGEVVCCQPWRKHGWHLVTAVDGSKDYYCFHGTIAIAPKFDAESGIALIPSPEAQTSVPVIATVDVLTAKEASDMGVRWAQTYSDGVGTFGVDGEQAPWR